MATEVESATPDIPMDEDVEDETEEKKLDEEEDVTGDGGVKKKILTEGKGWKTPKKGSDVEVHYVGRLEDGTQFDSSRDRNEPFKFKLGMGRVIKGWDKGVATMKKGEKALFTIKPEYGYGKAGSPPKIPPDATLLFEVELLNWNEFTDVTKDGGVLKETLESVDEWETPKEDATATIDYTLRLEDGTLIDEKQDFSFVIGAEEVPLGLDKAVKEMKKGERAVVTVRSDYGYGERGHEEQKIPGGATLKYEVRLTSFTKEKQAWEMKGREKLEACERAKQEGNALYKAGKFERASKKYKKAAGFVESDYSMEEDEKAAAKPLKIACYANAAACHLKLRKWKDAVDSCKKVLDLEPTNVKALFRRGQARVELDLWEEARADFDKVLEIEPDNKEAKREIAKLHRRIQQQEQKDRKRFKNIFERLAKMEEAEASSAQRQPQEAQAAAPADAMDVEAKSEEAKQEGNTVEPTEQQG